MQKPPADPKSFYIGWMPKAAPEYVGLLRVVILVLCLVSIAIAIFLVINQKEFSSGVFERSQTTELEGLLIRKPFPAIKTFYGKDIDGRAVVKTIPLVNKGKFGADSVVARMIAGHKSSHQHIWVKVKGKLIYNKGVALMELADEAAAMHLLSAPNESSISSPVIIEMGSATLKGQIIDPKCYLGVMKPGEGKPHSDCAIRCISGGIPPMLKIQDQSGEETLFMLLGENGETINQLVLPYIGIPVSVSGKIEQMDDWLVLNVTEIKKLVNR